MKTCYSTRHRWEDESMMHEWGKSFFLDTYWSTFLGAVDRGNVQGVEARLWIFAVQAVDSVTQFSFKVLNQGLTRAQHCYPLEQTYLCLLYTKDMYGIKHINYTSIDKEMIFLLLNVL